MRVVIKRVALAELGLAVRNCRTNRLTKNPAAKRPRGLFVLANKDKGLRDVGRWALAARGRGRAPQNSAVARPVPPGAGNSATLTPKWAIQLATLLRVHPECNPLYVVLPAVPPRVPPGQQDQTAEGKQGQRGWFGGRSVAIGRAVNFKSG